MMNLTDALVRRLVDAQLQRHPRTYLLYRTDAQFFAAVEAGRGTLQVVASAMVDAGLLPQQVDAVLQATLDRMLSDRALDEHDATALLRAISWPSSGHAR